MAQVDPPRFRPKQYPAPEFPPRKPAAFSRMPPAVFPGIFGLLGLGMALRRGLDALGQPAAIAETLLGAVCALWAFAAVGYIIKMTRRPAVLLEDLRILPGRAGLVSASLGLMMIAAVLVPYSATIAKAVLFIALALHTALALTVIRVLLTAPPEARGITPVWHLSFVGFIVGAVSAAPLGLTGLATALLWGTIPIAGGIWAVSLVQLIRRIPPAPLRPLMAIHLAPASLFATVAALLGRFELGFAFAVLAGIIFIALVASVRWLTEAGFSAMWGAFTFPLAAFAACLFALGLDTTGVMALIFALGVVPFVVFRIMKAWAGGQLAAKTNAAQA